MNNYLFNGILILGVPILNFAVGGSVYTLALCWLIVAFVSFDARSDVEILEKQINGLYRKAFPPQSEKVLREGE